MSQHLMIVHFWEMRIINSLEEFKKQCDVIVTNRWNVELSDVKDKVYTRDLYERD